VEHHALHRRLRSEHLDQVPRDRLALAVLVGREEELVGTLEGAAQRGDHVLGPALGWRVLQPEVVLDVDAETLARQIADVTEAGEHREVVAEEATDGVGLGLRLDDHEGFRHADSRIPGSVPGRR